MSGVPWWHYEAQPALRGDVAGPRLSYLDGALEILSPSKDHERIKAFIGRLLEAYAWSRHRSLAVRVVDGSRTPAARAARNRTSATSSAKTSSPPPEAMRARGDVAAPSLAIEVAWTTGAIDELEIYRRLGVSEVWIWKEDRIGV